MRVLRYLLVIGAVIGAFVSAARPSSAGVDETPPQCEVESRSNYSTMYPRDDGYRDTFSVTFSVTDEVPAPVKVQLLVLLPPPVPEDPPIEVYSEPEYTLASGASDTLTWNGRKNGGGLADEALHGFTIKVSDEAGNVNTCQVGVTVDHAKVTRTTFKKTFRAASTELERLVGKCSVLRKPSLRGWTGSLGYYSNKKCDNGFKPSRVVSANGVLVPKAFQNKYHSLQIKLYGGAAKARPGSEAALLYMKKDIEADSVLLRWMGPKLGTHAGARTGTKTPTFIRLDDNKSPYVAWNLITVNGLQYDVKNFTVVLEYTGLIDPNDTARASHTAARPQVSGGFHLASLR